MKHPVINPETLTAGQPLQGGELGAGWPLRRASCSLPCRGLRQRSTGQLKKRVLSGAGLQAVAALPGRGSGWAKKLGAILQVAVIVGFIICSRDLMKVVA